MELIYPIWFCVPGPQCNMSSLPSLGKRETRNVTYLRLSFPSLSWYHFPAILKVLKLKESKERGRQAS